MLSEKQENILDFINRFIAEEGYPPTIREIQKSCNISSTSVVSYNINSLQNKFNVPIGYSGHETGLQTTVASVVLGACLVERHITLDRALWGSDQSASIEPQGLLRLVRDIRVIESALGDGVKRVYKSELPIMDKLRRI